MATVTLIAYVLCLGTSSAFNSANVGRFHSTRSSHWINNKNSLPDHAASVPRHHPRRKTKNLHYSTIEVEPSVSSVDDSYSLFLDQRALRKTVQDCSLFSNWSALDVERIVQLSTALNVSHQEYVFHDGDAADGLYFVRSGVFEIVNEDKVLGAVRPGGYFGELALLFDQPRGISVRAAAPADSSNNTDGESWNSLWKLDKKIFNEIISGDRRKSAIVSVQKDHGLQDYLDKLELAQMVEKFPLFKTLDKGDLKRVVDSMRKASVAEGEKCITQGDVGDAMYFVESGKFECVDEATGKVVAVVEKGGYFGELALLFSQERAVTVRAATSDCEVWTLGVGEFGDAIEKSNISEQCLESLKQKYGETCWWKLFPKLNVVEVDDLLHQVSRPKKKKVSLHSTFSVMTAGALIPIFLSFWNPKWKGITGLPQLYDFLSPTSPNALLQLRFGTTCLALTGLLGNFRLPRNTPRSRRRIFNAINASLVTLLMIVMSSVTGSATYLFDAWTWYGRLLLGSGALVTMVNTALVFNTMISGEKDDGFTKMMSPAYETRPNGVLSTWFFVLGHYGLFAPLSVLLGSKSRFLSSLPNPLSVNYALYFHFIPFAVCTYHSLGALYSTLQYEKRLRPWKAISLLALTFTLCGLPQAFFMRRCGPFLPIDKVFETFLQRHSLGKCYFGFFGLVNIISLLRAWLKKRRGEWEL